MSLGGQNIQNTMLDQSTEEVMPVQAYSSGGKGGALTPQESQALQYYMAPQSTVMDQFNNTGSIIDPTALAQQAILSRPMNQPAYQPLLSSYASSTGGAQPGYTGLMYPSAQNQNLFVPSYTSRYDTSGGGGGGGSFGGAASTGMDTYGSYNSLSNGLVGALMGNLSSPSYGVTVDNMGTYAGQPGFGMGSAATGIGNPGESAGVDASASQSVSDQSSAGSDAGGYGTGDSSGGFGGGEY